MTWTAHRARAIDQHVAWTRRQIRAENPLSGYRTRGVRLRHERYRPGQHKDADYPPYSAVIHHEPETDIDGLLGGLGTRLQEIRKAEGGRREALPPNGRWITVHPNGDDEEGYPVYIVENPDHSHTIVSGVGGKLNGLRLTGVKSPQEYRQLARERRDEKVHALRERAAALRGQLGDAAYQQRLLEQEEARAQAQGAQNSAENEFIRAVAKQQGVDSSTLLPPNIEGIGSKLKERLAMRTHKAALAWAQDVAQRTRRVVLSAYDDYARDATGDVGIGAIAGMATEDAGRGYEAQIHQMAAENGLHPIRVRQQQRDVSMRGFLERSDYDLSAATRKMAAVARLQAGAAEAREQVRQAAGEAAQAGSGPDVIRTLPVIPQKLGDALLVLSAERQMQAARHQARQYSQEALSAQSAAVLPTAAVLTSQPLSDEESARAVADTLSESAMRDAMLRLVSTSNELDAESNSLRGHYSVGQTAAFCSIAEAVDGSTVDPIMVDTLGPAATASVLAAQWRAGMTSEESNSLRETLAQQHIDSQEKIANEGVERAQVALAAADAIDDDGKPQTPAELDAALGRHAQKVQLLRVAREAVGVARGRLEAAAALNAALMHPAGGSVQVSLGETSTADAVARAYAIGLTEPSRYDTDGKLLEEGQFTVHTDGVNRILELHPAGVKALAYKADPAARQRAQRSAAIKNGEQDETDWIPAGITRRPATIYENQPLQSQSIDHRMQVSDADDVGAMSKAIRQYAGGLVADGRDPLAVISDLSSAAFAADLNLSAEGERRFADAVSRVCPSYDDYVRGQPESERKKLLKAGNQQCQEAFDAHRERLRRHMEDYADEWVDARRKAGELGEEDASLDKQKVPIDEVTRDALFQSVLQDPRIQNSLVPLADVNSNAIRDYALEKMLHVDPKSQQILSRLSPEEAAVFRQWDDFKRAHGQSGVYPAIQQDMIRREPGDAGLFGDEAPQGLSLSKVNIEDDASVVQCAKDNAQALGYTRQLNQKTGQMEYMELQPGARFYDVGEGGAQVEYGPLTAESIARSARKRIRKKLKDHFIRNIVGSVSVADSAFDPDSVLTASNRWEMYVRHMGGLPRAVQTVRDAMTGDLIERFANLYHQRTGRMLQIRQRPYTHAQEHAEAMQNPEQMERRLADVRGEYARVGKDRGGKFTAGSRRDKAQSAKLLQEEGPKLFGQSALGAHIVPTTRLSAGRAVEKALAGMMPYVPVDKPAEAGSDLNMSGGRINQQRAVKLILANERQGLNLQCGAGKTPVQIGAFTQARREGRAKRALFVVPSNTVGQYGGEFLKFADPAEGLRWSADPRASAHERRAALGNSACHMVVMTPESLRSDITDAVAEDLGVTPAQAVKEMSGIDQDQLDTIVHEAMAKRGWNFDFQVYDEGHRLLGRAGKADAHMARVADSVGRAARFNIYSTADVVKNDPSEAFDVLHKLDPKRFSAEGRDKFLRQFRRNTVATGLALRQMLEPYIYAASVDTGVQHERHLHVLPMDEGQQTAYEGVMSAFRMARKARATHNGALLTRAMQQMSPGSFSDSEQQDRTAARLGDALGTMREAALNRVVNIQPGAKHKWVQDFVDQHRGEPTVIFARNISSVRGIAAALKASGHHVAVVTGETNAEDKHKAKIAFSPATGQPTADVLVSSDAGAMGANLQRGYHLINFDTPMTAMLHEQRIAREVRTGQKHAVDVHDLVADCDFDIRARQRLERKGQLREIMSAPTEQLDDTGLLTRLRKKQVADMANRYADRSA